MLPKLSEKRSVTFGTAVQEPAFISARRNALLDLKSISAIQVSCSTNGSEARYTVEVFTDSLNCRTTTATSSTSSSASTTSNDAAVECESTSPQSPIARIQKSLEEFIDLRDRLYRSVFLAHHRQYCKFCRGVLDPVISGVDPGGMFFTMFGEERATHKLTKFLKELLAPTVRSAIIFNSTRGCCSAQTLVPEAVHAFLFNPPNTS